MIFRTTAQIDYVSLGSIGGAIFTGTELRSERKFRFVADYKVLTREPVKGEFYYIEGMQTHHRDHGEQIRVSKCQFSGLPSPTYLNRFLSKHPAFRGFGLGKQKISKLISHVGDEKILLDLIDRRDIKSLTACIAEPIAIELCNRWAPISEETKLLRFFIEYDIPVSLFGYVDRVFKYDAVDRIQANPYSLLAFFPSSPSIWRNVDKTGKALKFSKDAEQRLIGATEFIFYLALETGDTAIPKSELLSRLSKLLKSDVLANKAMQATCQKKAICSFISSAGNLMFQSLGAAVIESSLEKHVAGLWDKSNENIENDKIDRLLKKMESVGSVSLTSEQVSAVRLAVSSSISVITGFGGTGKTTVIKTIAEIFQRLGSITVLTALAGKAKQRLEHVTGMKGHCFTIHGAIDAIKSQRLIGTSDRGVDRTLVVIIDEASMVDIALANRLLNALSGWDYRLVLVGDNAQLSPVGFGLFFHVLIGKVPTSYLTQVHRQTQDSPIHQMAMQVRAGSRVDIPTWKGQREGVYFLDCEGDQKSIIRAVGQVMSKVSCQIISPHAAERMQDNVHSLNGAMQFLMNLGKKDEELDVWEIEKSRPIFRVGNIAFLENDPVIVTRNQYELSLFNGSSGVIKRIVLSEDGQPRIEVAFENGSYFLTKEQCLVLGLQLAYAISVHKSQGSEYESVIVSCAVRSKLLDRSLIYTALTRSKKLAVFVGSRDVLSSAIKGKPRHLEIAHGFSVSKLESRSN
ncbi:AAA family ATPase [Alteromonas lipotrueiana]|uniref:AAA family ATPase n=1 Tax=Alteromonas lipotrueiana TaxID=2803815 RepID=UPI001FEAFDF9|nr:AAA family ATPase [Alteromonas lipotrueiana]